MPTFTGRGRNPDAILVPVVGAYCSQWLTVLHLVSFVADQGRNIADASHEYSVHF